MLRTPPNVRIVRSYKESDALMKFFKTPVIRLQANLEKVRNNTKMGPDDVQATELNACLFQEWAIKNPDVVFILVTDGTYCYWSFYDGQGNAPKHFSCLENNKITFDRSIICSNWYST